MTISLSFLVLSLRLALPVANQSGSEGALELLEPIDVFQLEYAAQPRISPSGEHVVYVRHSMDVLKDRRRSHLWLASMTKADHRPLFSEDAQASNPLWSPSGDRLAFVASSEGSAQLFLRWMDTGQTARLTQLEKTPRGLSWSPDGSYLAFTMHVEVKPKPFAKLPPKPEGAEWAEPAKVITRVKYRSDGAGYTSAGNVQLFVLPTDGGTPRALTEGPFDVAGTPQWSADGERIYFSSNRREDSDYEPADTELYSVELEDGSLTRLSSRYGPDKEPRLSPDGRWIAFTGYDDQLQGYQITQLYVMDAKGGEARVLTAGLDRSVQQPRWDPEGQRIYFLYDDQGDTRIASVDLEGQLRSVADSAGGMSLGRPYAAADYDVGSRGRVVYTRVSPYRPADLALISEQGESARSLTALNEDLLGHKTLGEVEELRFSSAHDGRELQGWLVKPPGFELGSEQGDPDKRYPLLLEIHGGPFANYGPRFAAEIQLFAAAGYVVFYMNPRGSTSYGQEFGNLIHHAYPGHDYDDLMSGVDACLAKGFVDPDRMFVTGGSGGGVLTAWIVGKTQRFRAAVVAKPVINWTSFALTADAYNFFHRYWFPGFPWDHNQHYFERSPLSLVGNVETPTMVLTGEEDYRTPISESEQYYQALKLRKIDAALVRIPGASHGIAARPSHLISKVLHILEWFARHTDTQPGNPKSQGEG